MLIAVTGGTGFIGGYICRGLVDAGHRLRALARPSSDTSLLSRLGLDLVIDDLGDPANLAGLIIDADAVIHAAVDFRACRDDQMANFRGNLLRSLELMDLARRDSVKQYIFISTGAVHETILDDRPLDEAHPLWPHSTYGAYKAAVEAFLPAYREQFGFNACAVRPTSVYGIHLTRPKRSHWYDLVRRVVRGERIETGHGGKVVHVEDVAAAVVGALGREDVAGHAYELTDCHVYDQTVAEFAKEISGSDSEIVDLKGAGPRHQIVSDKARQTFGIGLDRGHEGIRAYVEQLVKLIGE